MEAKYHLGTTGDISPETQIGALPLPSLRISPGSRAILVLNLWKIASPLDPFFLGIHFFLMMISNSSSVSETSGVTSSSASTTISNSGKRKLWSETVLSKLSGCTSLHMSRAYLGPTQPQTLQRRDADRSWKDTDSGKGHSKGGSYE